MSFIRIEGSNLTEALGTVGAVMPTAAVPPAPGPVIIPQPVPTPIPQPVPVDPNSYPLIAPESTPETLAAPISLGSGPYKVEFLLAGAWDDGPHGFDALVDDTEVAEFKISAAPTKYATDKLKGMVNGQSIVIRGPWAPGPHKISLVGPLWNVYGYGVFGGGIPLDWTSPKQGMSGGVGGVFYVWDNSHTRADFAFVIPTPTGGTTPPGSTTTVLVDQPLAGVKINTVDHATASMSAIMADAPADATVEIPAYAQPAVAAAAVPPNRINIIGAGSSKTWIKAPDDMPYQDKGIFIMDNGTIKGMKLTGAANVDRNGAALRDNGSGCVSLIDDIEGANNDMAVLLFPKATLLTTNSFFHDNGQPFEQGKLPTHGMYLNAGDPSYWINFLNNVWANTINGHHLKVRHPNVSITGDKATTGRQTGAIFDQSDGCLQTILHNVDWTRGFVDSTDAEDFTFFKIGWESASHGIGKVQVIDSDFRNPSGQGVITLYPGTVIEFINARAWGKAPKVQWGSAAGGMVQPDPSWMIGSFVQAG